MVEATTLTDGQWHRLHPMTPLLKGGFMLLAIMGFVVAQMRQRLIDLFVGDGDEPGDLIDVVVRNGWILWALLIVLGVLLIVVAVSWLSWRLHTFRVTDDAVEVRSGILSRSYRNARLDRVQGVNVTHPFIARLFGAAKLEVSVAGQNANVALTYLGTAHARGVRSEILRRASGAQRPSSQRPFSQGTASQPGQPTADATPAHPSSTDAAAHPAAAAAAPDALAPAAGTTEQGTEPPLATDFVTERARDLLGPELDTELTNPESVVRISWVRILGSMLASIPSVIVVLGAVGVIVGLIMEVYWPLAAALPFAIGLASFYFRRFTRSVRYSIAGTPNGVRVGFGLASTTNETLPPGRIHAIELSQPILWRPFGWWQIAVNTAGHSQQQRGAANQSASTILPVGDADDVVAVLALLQPQADSDDWAPTIRSGMTSRRDDLFVSSPRRARYVHPFSWRRTGYAIVDGTVQLRRGILWRRLTIVPLARLQSTSITQGPFYRPYRLVTAHLHTVAGPVTATLPAVDAAVGDDLFESTARLAVEYAASDTSHRWAEGA